jgi:predicted ATP-binding protein involved in virulence
MRIDRLTIQNFRRFESLTLDLHPQFNLLVGGNGSGKTTILDALAICLSIWPLPQRRYIEAKDVRMTSVKIADQTQFQEWRPVTVKAVGQIGTKKDLVWEQSFDSQSHWLEVDSVHQSINQLVQGSPAINPLTWPLLVYYGVTRASLPQGRSGALNVTLKHARREDAYTNWISERLDYDELRRWFYRETAAMGANGGRKRLGYEIVRRAVFGCVPGADDLWFDVDRADLVCSLDGQAQPLSNLSDGQRMLLTMVADIAVRAVTLNAHLLPSDELGGEGEFQPQVLHQTPGVILIDELDVHLHPSWQRRVAADLKRTFPALQFVCTSHSPQVIGELPKEQIKVLMDDAAYSPEHSFGLDSSRVLEEIMRTRIRNKDVDELLAKIARQIGDDDFAGARATIKEATEKLGEDDPEVTRAQTLLAFVEPQA